MTAVVGVPPIAIVVAAPKALIVVEAVLKASNEALPTIDVVIVGVVPLTGEPVPVTVVQVGAAVIPPPTSIVVFAAPYGTGI